MLINLEYHINLSYTDNDTDMLSNVENVKHAGFVLIVIAAVLGGVALLLALIYAYIYYTKAIPRLQSISEVRDAGLPHSSTSANDQQGLVSVKGHPLFALSNKVEHSSVMPSTSSKRY